MVQNPAKRLSEDDGRAFLRQSLIQEQEVLRGQLMLSASSITHNGVKGEVNEEHFISILRRYLPRRYGVDQGIVIDSNGQTSDQIDIIIYDPQYTPPLLDQQSHRYILAEAVYAVIEAKAMINKVNIMDHAVKHAQSVRRLHRSSSRIVDARGSIDGKKSCDGSAMAVFPILAGIVALDAEWNGGLNSEAFKGIITSLNGNQTISFGFAANDLAFDLAHAPFDATLAHGALTFSHIEGSLAWFLFNLLKRLQHLGTVPAVDWNRYRAVLSGID
jgi:hypothetical protein